MVTDILWKIETQFENQRCVFQQWWPSKNRTSLWYYCPGPPMNHEKGRNPVCLSMPGRLQQMCIVRFVFDAPARAAANAQRSSAVFEVNSYSCFCCPKKKMKKMTAKEGESDIVLALFLNSTQRLECLNLSRVLLSWYISCVVSGSDRKSLETEVTHCISTKSKRAACWLYQHWRIGVTAYIQFPAQTPSTAHFTSAVLRVSR